jgi:hypothetical protein
VIVQRRCTSCCSSVENIPLQAERHSGRRQKLFTFPPESAFTFRPECCSASQRNGVQLQTGIAFTFDRIPHLSFSTLDRHLKKRRWKRRRRPVSSAGRLVKVELATKKSPTPQEPSCGLAVVLPGGRRIEVHPDFDTNTFERLVSALERV